MKEKKITKSKSIKPPVTVSLVLFARITVYLFAQGLTIPKGYTMPLTSVHASWVEGIHYIIVEDNQHYIDDNISPLIIQQLDKVYGL